MDAPDYFILPCMGNRDNTRKWYSSFPLQTQSVIMIDELSLKLRWAALSYTIELY